MKNGQLSLLGIAGSAVGSISFFIPPEEYPFLKYSLLLVAAIIILLFHLLTFKRMLKKEKLQPPQKIFWTVAIICLPLIGDVIYLVLDDVVKT